MRLATDSVAALNRAELDRLRRSRAAQSLAIIVIVFPKRYLPISSARNIFFRIFTIDRVRAQLGHRPEFPLSSVPLFKTGARTA